MVTLDDLTVSEKATTDQLRVLEDRHVEWFLSLGVKYGVVRPSDKEHIKSEGIDKTCVVRNITYKDLDTSLLNKYVIVRNRLGFDKLIKVYDILCYCKEQQKGA